MVTRPVPANLSINVPRDPNTLANYNAFRTRHTSVTFAIDFDKKVVSGSTALELESLTDGETDELVLDTRYLHCVSNDGLIDINQSFGH